MTNTTDRARKPEQGPLGRLLDKLAPPTAGQTMQATWNGVVIAESDDTLVVEGNHYFTLDAAEPDFLQESTHHTVCPWKGVASYFDVVVDGKVNRNAARYYPSPSTAARDIAGRVAFWHGVRVGRAG